MTVNLALTIEQTNLVLRLLADLPYKESADLINQIRMQAQQSIQEQQAIEQSPPKAVASEQQEEITSSEEHF